MHGAYAWAYQSGVCPSPHSRTLQPMLRSLVDEALFKLCKLSDLGITGCLAHICPSIQLS